VSDASIRVADGPAAGTVIQIGDEPLVIGRSPQTGGDAGTLGGDPELSRLHARISDRDGHLWIEDLGSSNGTFVNGRRIESETDLHPGDVIKVGTTTLTMEGASSRAATAARVATPEMTRVREVVPAPRSPQRGGGEPELEVVAGKSMGTCIRISTDPVVIGRGATGAGQLPGDAELSREHARVSRRNGDLVLEDLVPPTGRSSTVGESPSRPCSRLGTRSGSG